MKAAGRQYPIDLAYRFIGREDMLQDILRDEDIKGFIFERKRFYIFAALPPNDRSTLSLFKEKRRGITATLCRKPTQRRGALVNSTIAPVRTRLIENVNECPLPGNGTASSAQIVIPQPTVFGLKSRFRFADYTVALVGKIHYLLAS